MPIAKAGVRIPKEWSASTNTLKVLMNHNVNRLQTFYSNTDPVSVLYDLAENNLATNGAGVSTKPVFTDNVFGTKPGLSFALANTQYLSPQDTISAGAKTVALVFKLRSVPTSFHTAFQLGNGSSVGSELLFSTGGSYQTLFWTFDNIGGGSTVGYNMTHDTNAHVVVISYNGGTYTTPGNYTLMVDGTAQTVIAGGSYGVASFNSRYGQRTNGGFPADFYLGDLTVMKEAANLTQMLAISRALGAEFGITTA